VLELYHAEKCPYCVKVRLFFENNAVAYISKPVPLRQGSPIKDELVKIGGKAQVPYLVDTGRQTKMYESDDIIAYVKKNYLTT
jgi:glutathione S-transferase